MNLLKLAEYLEVKWATEVAPKAVTSGQLTQLTPEERAEVKAQGKNEEYKPFDKAHNPPSWAKNKAIWDRAKKAVKPYRKNYKEPWSVISHVYFQMGGEKKHKSK